ncbi:penicillin-binding protein 2 [Nitrosomonas sp. Nm132]|jgi:cell division protein FtsI (penicillin-binding protein 3)|uniref:peptidoglycan D,D-transpeptidase FtsI family protein n=1 Tax=Nitrosomonas sp. Nm132 TaxID=1881053 RepID=UPI000888B22C|nr:penicillin-binding protein 2 [Nitrosomonas sp. Nm132]SDH59377.1 cell division protein FtsI (penicillin-binding protein 3) [Nitrosomonas sp. Nm132]
MRRDSALSLVLPIWRSRLLIMLLLLGLVALAGRAIYLQGLNKDFLQQQGQSRYSRIVELNAQRGKITDRHGEILAISAPVKSVWADPQKMNATPEQLQALAHLIEIDVDDIRKRISDQDKRFVHLRRQLSPEMASGVANLNISGVYLKREFYRYYPTGEMAAHILGFTNIDGKGQEGVELGWEDILTGEHGSRRVIKDRIGRVIESVEKIRSPRPGQNLMLSIDSKIQYLAHRELKRAVKANHAKAGSVIVLDVQTGEVLGLANYPTYNPNQRSSIRAGKTRNRALVDVFEPGSTLKPFAVAVAMETGKINPDTLFQTSPGTLKIGNATIRDVRNKGTLSVSQVIQESSNVGAAKIALLLPPKTLWEMLSRSGFGMPTGSNFPGEVNGRLRPYHKWRPIEQATMSYGHGISVNLMQLARAYTIFAAEGQLKPVSLLKRDAPPVGQQVISRKTALAMSSMLETVVQPGGTGLQAKVNGYRVAGKTGTAHKPLEGMKGYAKNRYISTFVGYAPVSNPRLVVAVMIDEPSAGQYYGGAVAAPLFSQVMTGALRQLGVPHDALGNIVTSPMPVTLKSEG